MPPKTKKSPKKASTTEASSSAAPASKASTKKPAVAKGGAKVHRKVYRDNIRGVTNPALKRLLHRAGVKLNSSLIYEEARTLLMQYMNHVVDDIVTLAEYARRKTVTSADVRAALALSGQDLVAGWSKGISGCPTGPKKVIKPAAAGAVEGEVKKKHKSRPGTSALRDIRRQQKASDCLAISKQPFQRLTREVASDVKGDLHFSNAAVQLLQLAAEDALIKLFENANLIAINSNRSRLFPKDLSLSAKILAKPYW